jgi:DNA-binding winged helix-turn-helix (wHTH) protein
MLSNSMIQHHDSRARIERRVEPTTSGAFRLNSWLIEPSLGRISAEGVERVVEPKTMEVLVHLAARAGEVTSSDELIDSVWRGRPMGDNPVHKCISQLRSALGDDARRPRYIGTIPKRGYRLLSPVERLERTPTHLEDATPIRVCIDIWPMCVRTASSVEPDLGAAARAAPRDEREGLDSVLAGTAPKLYVTVRAAEGAEGDSRRAAAVDLELERVTDIIRHLALAMRTTLR